MILSWMLYSVALAFLIGGASLAVERLLRLLGKATRWVWLVAFVAVVVFPGARIVFPNAHLPLPAANQNEAGFLRVADDIWHLPNQVLADTDKVYVGLDSVVFTLWAASSLLLLVLFSWSWLRLRRETRFCSSAEVDGIPVLVSSALGPALIVLRKQTIVLPSWVFECESDVRAMIARHEREHVRTGDQRLVIAAFVLVLLLPWNLALWWYSSRLRLAVEVDCDERLLKAGANLRTYSRLLLDLGTRSGPAPVAALAFSRNRSSLFRRIQHMTSKPRKRALQASFTAMVGLGFVLLACDMPLPLAETESPGLTLQADSLDFSIGSDGSELSAEGPLTIRMGSSGPDDESAELKPLVYIDGVRIHESVDVVVDTLSRDRIDRIEVIKGGAAKATYGEDAANGVIHIYLKVAVQEHDEGTSGN